VWFLSTRYPYRDEVDLGLKALGDLTVQAEVRRYRGHEYHLNRLAKRADRVGESDWHAADGEGSVYPAIGAG
jgi:hypothetical protein